MRRIDITALREMHAAATPGPWKIVATKDPSGEWDAYAKAKDGLPVDLEHTDNLPAVCAAMNALPALLREVELLRAVRKAASNRLRGIWRGDLGVELDKYADAFGEEDGDG
jgi:hypothetical protein